MVRQQDDLIVQVQRQLLQKRTLRCLSNLYYFHRWQPPKDILDFLAITRRGFERVLAKVVGAQLRDQIAKGPDVSRVLPEAHFAYGNNVTEELRFWRLLRWLSDVAGDLLSTDASSARMKALDVHYGRLRRGPGFRPALEGDMLKNSESYRRLVRRDGATEFWTSLACVGRGQPWDHFYFHLVLGTDPDAAYNSGVEPSRQSVEQALGLP